MESRTLDDFSTTKKLKRPNKVKIGVCGGRFGGAFQWHLDPDCVVEAVCELDPKRRTHLMETYKCSKSYASLAEMLKDRNVEAVAIFTPADDHVRHAVEAMKAGKHVVSAVPAAQSVSGCEALIAAVKETGMTYMMAETSYYRSGAILARQYVKEGAFGNVFYTEAEYHHPGIDALFFDEEGKKTWRFGRPPMFQSSHCTAYVVGVTGERLTDVSCLGYNDGSLPYKENVYNNPFCNETALFKTDLGNAFRVSRTWTGAHRGCERAQWYGEKMSYFMDHPNGWPSVIARPQARIGADDAGFKQREAVVEKLEAVDLEDAMLPEPMRVHSGHGGSHAFLTHEFVDALMRGRTPAISVEVALAMASAAVTAHRSALEGGKQLAIPQYRL